MCPFRRRGACQCLPVDPSAVSVLHGLGGNLAGTAAATLLLARLWSCLWPNLPMFKAWHMQSRRWLTEKLATPSPMVTVVVTHHSPHPGSIDPKDAGSLLNPAFCSDFSALIEQSGPASWVHGHTLASCDYCVGSMRVVCNPKKCGPSSRGMQIENSAFNPALVVSLSSARCASLCLRAH